MDINLSYDAKEACIIIKDFIKTYVENSGCKGVVIGLSGGIDSAVVALLCKDALGKRNTQCIFLPDETTPEQDTKHMNLLIKKFNLLCKEKDVTDIVKQISSNCIVKPDKYVLANLKARTRMILLYEYANVTKSLVCGTSNKSEILVGYFTKYGDGAADLQPIGDLYKTQIFELAKFLKIPKEIISKKPCAGLWKGQTDEAELKISYTLLDKILVGLERKMEIDDIASIVGLKNSEIERIKKMVIKSQHKRAMPLIPKIGLKSMGLDWRSK